MIDLDDLMALPAPTVIETLDYEAILAELLAEFRRRYPDYSALLESDPAMKLLEVAAYRELLLRNRINFAARATLLAFSSGTDLDHLAAFYGVQRLPQESDASLRRRVQARIVGWATAGGAAHYRYWALSASAEIADVAIDSPMPGVVRISVLGRGHTEQPTSPELLEAVRAVVLRDDVKVLTDTVEVVSAELIPVAVHAHLWLYPDTPIELYHTLAHRLRQALAEQSGLGWDLTRSWIIATLHPPGVHKVELLSPLTDIRCGPHQAVRLADLQLTFAGRDR